ncbi:MAG: hypothetical protein J6T62_11065 [Fibrobacter sp.]|nr:hypothetical protein [Fibrobacter sp.]
MKRVFLLVLTFCLIVCAKVNPTAPALNNGCYSISTTDELYGFAAIVNGTFEVGRAAESFACGKLENDVWANDSLRTYCGNKVETNETTGEEDSVYVCYRYSSAQSRFVEVDPATVEPREQWIPLKNFSGSFDGQGHAIWELENVEDSTQDNLGFIASVVGGTKASPVVIRNLTLRDAVLNGRDTVGGIVAKNSGYLLLDDVASLMSISARNHAGSFVGRNEGHLVVKKGVTSSVEGKKFVGGAVGSNSGTVDVDSLALKIAFDVAHYGASGYGAYVVANSHAGLILGLNEKSASLSIRNIEVDENSVWADSVVGGLVGVNEKDAEISISTTAMVYYLATDRKAKVGGFVAVNRGIVDIANSYIRGGVSGTMSGCFVGVNEDSLSITNSYSACTWESVSGDPIVAGCGGRISLKNTFYLENCGGFCSAPVTASCADNMGAKPVTDNEVRNGVLAIHLHNNQGGDVWGQDTSKDYYPKLHATFGTYEFKLHLGYFNLGSNTQWCSPDTSITSYVYTKGVDQFPVCWQYGYEFLGWAYENNPDSIITSIGKTEYGDINLVARWTGDAVVPPQDKDGCYLVSSVGEFYGIYEIPGKKICVKLVKDIVINANMNLDDEFSLRDWYGLYGYHGVFDGQGHTISGLYDHGLFTDVLEGDTLVIKNLGIEDSHVINQGRSVFVRSNRGVVIIDSCFSSFPSGGFVESNNGHLYVSNSYNTGSIYTGSSIVSTNNGVAVLDHVYNTGTVNCSGGLLGSNSGKAFISNSYNVGKITKNCGSGRVGGIAGFNNGEMEIVNCYSANNFDTAMNAGGFVGNHFLGSLKIINSYSAGIHAGNYGIVGIPDSPPLHGDRYAIYLDNVYYSAGVGDTTGLGIQATPAVFENGYVAKLLHDYVQKDENGDVVANGITGEIWGQEVGVDPLPVFKGVLVGAADSAGEGDIIDAPGPVVASSSSSKVKSSSSSNGEIDSSSSAKSSSSNGEIVSSSSKVKSSSSSSHSAKSSSSSKTNVVSHLFERGAIHIETSRFGHGILITGIPARLQFVMFDMLGHKVASGVSGCSGIALEGVPAGRYYLLAADGRFVVNVRP